MIAPREPQLPKIEIVQAKLTNEGIPEREPFLMTPADYTLYCHICGEETVRLAVSGNRMRVSSPLRSYQIEVEGAGDYARKAAEGEMKPLNSVLTQDFDGLDFYCPECDKMYCEKHWDINPEWDEGFYDHTEGTCPKGHLRRLDD